MAAQSTQTSSPQVAGQQSEADRLVEQGTFRIRFQMLRVVFALFIREMTTSYGRTRLGFLWAILEPIGGIALLAVGFSFIFKKPSLGQSFLLFYATGFLPYTLYVALHSRVAVAIRQNKALLFYPAVTFLDVIIARSLLTALTQIVVMIVVLGGIVTFQPAGVIVRYDMLFLSTFLALLLGTGVGMINSVLFERFPSWVSIWQIFNRPMFFVSGVLFIIDTLPDAARDLFWWNPLIHVIGYFRKGFYPEYNGEYLSALYAGGIGFVLVAIGLMLLRGSHRFIINN